MKKVAVVVLSVLLLIVLIAFGLNLSSPGGHFLPMQQLQQNFAAQNPGSQGLESLKDYNAVMQNSGSSDEEAKKEIQGLLQPIYQLNAQLPADAKAVTMEAYASLQAQLPRLKELKAKLPDAKSILPVLRDSKNYGCFEQTRQNPCGYIVDSAGPALWSVIVSLLVSDLEANRGDFDLLMEGMKEVDEVRAQFSATLVDYMILISQRSTQIAVLGVLAHQSKIKEHQMLARQALSEMKLDQPRSIAPAILHDIISTTAMMTRAYDSKGSAEIVGIDLQEYPHIRWLRATGLTKYFFNTFETEKRMHERAMVLMAEIEEFEKNPQGTFEGKNSEAMMKSLEAEIKNKGAWSRNILGLSTVLMAQPNYSKFVDKFQEISARNKRYRDWFLH